MTDSRTRVIHRKAAMSQPPAHRTTADAGIPGAFEGETVTRRRLMSGTAQLAAAVAGSAIVLPVLGFAAAPVFERDPTRWRRVAPLRDIPLDTYLPQTITATPGIGTAGKAMV